MPQKTNSSCQMSSSPATSGGSRNGTPDTKLTPMSPMNPRVNGYAPTPIRGNGFVRYGAHNGLADPFTDAAASAGNVLSPTANSFTPSGIMSLTGQQRRSSVSFLAATSVPDTPGHGATLAHRPAQFGAIGMGLTGGHHSARPALPKIGNVDVIRRSRAFAVSNVNPGYKYIDVAHLFDRREFLTLRGPILTELATTGTMYVGFTDARDATKAFEKVQDLHPNWEIHPLTGEEFGMKSNEAASNFEGQINARVTWNPEDPGLHVSKVAYSFKDLLTTFGDLKGLQPVPMGPGRLDVVAEFYDSRAVGNAIRTLNGSCVDGCQISVKEFSMEDDRDPNFHPRNAATAFPVNMTPARPPYMQVNSPARAMYTPNSSNSSHGVRLSPTGRSTVPINDPATAMWGPSPTAVARVRRSAADLNHARNQVEIPRIRMGIDVRTTVMLRNIPNRVDHPMLKNLLDMTSFGQYDFLYLRIDFHNNCNVGYAFINFVDPIDIVDFYNARAGKPWGLFNSDKIAEISYATIQGRECLIQKFRNSSVMLEDPLFRPKLYYTGYGSLAGTEEPFPEPNNLSKMRRSVDNAEHVGLFTPRSNQHYRAEQRRAPSQFDRGTPAAQRDNCGYYGHPSNSSSPGRNTQYDMQMSMMTPTRPMVRRQGGNNSYSPNRRY